MDVTFSNVLEGTRQYFMGLPKQALPGSGGAHSVSASSSRPPPAAPPHPPRPPSEPLEPEPHIIHKATVMREAAEKRRERPTIDDEESVGALSPPSHIIHKPAPRVPPPASPAPAPAAPSPSPARPPSAAPERQLATTSSPAPFAPPVPPLDAAQYRSPAHRVQTPTSRLPDHFAPGRPPDPYPASRPPELYARYHYESSLPDGGRNSRVPPVVSPQPSAPMRLHSPQTYARMSSSMPQHASRLREAAVHSPPTQRYAPAPPPNDRVPPIHHPHAPTPTRVPPTDARSSQYPLMTQHREPSPYGRAASHYDRHPALPQRKYDPQQAYSGYRPAATAPQPLPSHRVEPHHQIQYKIAAMDAVASQYVARPLDRVAPPPQPYPHEHKRHSHDGHVTESRKPEYPNTSRTVDARSSYHYPVPSTSAVRYTPNPATAPVPVVPNSTLPTVPKPVHRSATAPKSNYEYATLNHVQTSPARSTVKPGYPSQQARMTVSVTSLVNQMNQTKHKRESPLDLSVKTVKNSADSSTTQDDLVDSATPSETKSSLQPRPTSTSRLPAGTPAYVESHKVDFAPDFTQYRERISSHSYSIPTAPAPAPAPVLPGHHPVRYNGSYETPRPVAEPYPAESRHHVYPDRIKHSMSSGRAEYVPQIDLTRAVGAERRPDNRIRDDRHFIIEERKRPAGPIVNNIPEKMVRYETWTADSRISDRMTQSAREQQELMSRPVYSYSSHKQFETFQNEQKRAASSTSYREYQSQASHRFSVDTPSRERNDYHTHYHDRNPSSSSRHVIQKLPSHRGMHPHHSDTYNVMPDKKRVLSILRNSLETKQTGLVEPAKLANHVPDLIVIDDVDDSVIEITDLTKDNDMDASTKALYKSRQSQIDPTLGHHIQMPKAVDSIPRETNYQKLDSANKSPENDVASRIRTKAELKVMPPSQDRHEVLQNINSDRNRSKILPKSQKQHLFNQIREDLKLVSVIKSEKCPDPNISEVKSEPMNIDEIEKDAEVPIKTENNILEKIEPDITDSSKNAPEDDLDWASACDSFMEQLKSGSHGKITHRKRVDTVDRENENKITKIPKAEPPEICTEQLQINPPSTVTEKVIVNATDVIIKQEPIDDNAIKNIDSTINEKDITEVNKSLFDDESDKELTKINCQKSSSLDDTNEEKDIKINKLASSQPDKEEMEQTTSNKCTVTIESPKKSQFKFKKSLTSKISMVKRKYQLKNKSMFTSERKDTEGTKLKKSPVVKESNEKEKIQAKKRKSLRPHTDIDKNNMTATQEKNKIINKNKKIKNKTSKSNSLAKIKVKLENNETTSTSTETSDKSEIKEIEPIKTVIKEELESTDDDEPLIKSKIMKEKEMKYQLLKDLSEKSAYVKLECFDVDMNKNTRISIDSLTKEEKSSKRKAVRQMSRTKGKSLSMDNTKIETSVEDSTTDTDDDELSVACRLRLRKNIKTEDNKSAPINKTPIKSSPSKKQDNMIISNCSTPIRKPGFGDGSDFHPGWEDELYRYKRSLRMPTRLIAIPRGRSGGPFVRGSGALFTRGSTSLPDLDPAPLSPASSLAPSAATDDLYARRPDKLAIDSDLDSNSSCSAPHRLHYDSEASTSTIFSSSVKKKSSSIVDVLIQKCGRRDDSKKKPKDKDNKTPKLIPKGSNTAELLATPSLGLIKNGNMGSLSAKKEKLREDIYYLGAFRKETVTAFRSAFIKNTDGLIGATEEFAPVVLKSRTRTESRVLKQRATIKEVFGDERPASAPPACRNEEEPQETEHVQIVEIKKEPKEPETKPKLKPKKILKDKLLRRSNSIRDGLRSTKSLKRNDAKGRMMRLKKRNSIIKSITNKRKDISGNKIRKEKIESTLKDEDKSKEEGSSTATAEVTTKKRLKRLFGRRKFSSGFDYIRKKKKIIRRDDTPNNRIRRPAVKPSPESVHDIHKEIKAWFINKSIGETHLHRAARFGYTDCVAYCLEKMAVDPSAKDNAGFTPLHFAASKGHVRIARLLLEYGANVSAAAQGGIRPLHEASENSHVEVIRLLLSYGADPLLGTYAGQTPEELTEGTAALLLRLHIADVQGLATEPWRFPPPADIIDRDELGCDPLSSPPPASPPPPPDSMVEIQCTEAPLPPFYSLRASNGQPAEGLWCLLQDITNLLQIKSKESLLKQIHCGSGSPKELFREIRTQEFLERAQCNQLLGAGEKVNVRASKVSLVRVTDKLRQLLKIETVLVS